nr:hypothetical protein [Nocardia panacis]
MLSSPHVPRKARSGVLMIVLALGLSAFGAGCGDGAEVRSVSDGTEPLGLGKEVTVPITAAVAAVVQPGAEPREPLRPRYSEGTVQQVTLRTDHRIAQQINDQPVRDYSTPALTIPMTARSGPDGIECTLGAVSTPDPSLNKALGTADGSRAGFDLSELGAITALRLAPNPDTANSARAALEQAFYQAIYQSVTFPDEPLGEGAVWTMRQQIAGGVNLDQVITATLAAREGDRLTIDLTVVQKPRNESWNLPNNAGALDIQDYVMHGSGTITVDLGMPLPVAGTITVGGHQTYRDPHSFSVLQQTIDTRVTWSE